VPAAAAAAASGEAAAGEAAGAAAPKQGNPVSWESVYLESCTDRHDG
jgi:hypothetical protein